MLFHLVEVPCSVVPRHAVSAQVAHNSRSCLSHHSQNIANRESVSDSPFAFQSKSENVEKLLTSLTYKGRFGLFGITVKNPIDSSMLYTISSSFYHYFMLACSRFHNHTLSSFSLCLSAKSNNNKWPNIDFHTMTS